MNPKTIAVIIGVLIVTVVGVFLFQTKEPLSFLPSFNFAALAGSDPQEVVPEKTGDSAQTETYHNPNYLFSLNYPKGYTIGNFSEGESDIILFQSQSGRESFQVVITLFDEPAPIDAARITKDLPDVSVEDSAQAFIGKGKQVEATVFFSHSDSLGKTREVWFVWPPEPTPDGNYLYQVTAPAHTDTVIGPILDTLSFE